MVMTLAVFPGGAIAIGISPFNSDIQLAGGVIGRRSTDGGSTWAAAHPVAMHVDLHGYYFNALDGSVYACHDGGISRSINKYRCRWKGIHSTRNQQYLTVFMPQEEDSKMKYASCSEAII